MPDLGSLCPSCFLDHSSEGPCPACGFTPGQERSAVFLPLGKELRGELIVGQPLGKPGGFGITYLCWNPLLEERIAVKEYFPRGLAVRERDGSDVHPPADTDLETYHYGIRQFLEEARRLARFRHPNIVRVRGFFEENGTAYLVMDYHAGKTLGRYLADRGGRLPERQALQILGPVLDGLEHVHAKGFLHRDVKPSNIYLAEDGAPILLDFGAARAALGERTETLSVLLTPGYAPIEQYHARGRQGPWTDVYSVAATLYRMVTGNEPPDANGRAEEDTLVPAERITPGVSPSVGRAIREGMSIRRQDRPQSIASFRSLLPPPEAAPSSSPTPARTPPPPSLENLPETAVALRPSPQPVAARGPEQRKGTVPAGRGADRPVPPLARPAGEGAVVRKKRPWWSVRPIYLYALLLVLLPVFIGIYMTVPEVAAKRVRPKNDTPAAAPETPQATEARSAQAASFETWRNSIDKLAYIWVPPGTYDMGCSPRDDRCAGNEKPSRTVFIRQGFWMGQTEVPVWAYKAYVSETERALPSAPDFNPGWQTDGLPMVNVTPEEASAFCKWSGARLPLENEWEYAARGPGNARFPWGWAFPSCSSGYGGAAFADCGLAGPKPVDSFTAVGFGFQGLAGNVWEWCDNTESGSSTRSMVRGGSWRSGSADLRVSAKSYHHTRENDIGFRCVRGRL